MTTRMSSKGQIVIPRKACDALGVHTGTEFIISIEDGSYRLVPKKKTMEKFFAFAGTAKSALKKSKAHSVHDEIGDYLLEKDTETRKRSRALPLKNKKR